MDRPNSTGGRAIYVSQGKIAVDNHPGTVISTLLGSCVSVCLHDPVAGVGGMNHILLPDAPIGSPGATGVAVHAMETLVNPILKLGGDRYRLEAKVFGGASFSGVFGDIGGRNVDFVMNFLEVEGIECTGQSVGGHSARRLKFWPALGRVQQKMVQDAPDEIILPITVVGNGAELF